MINSKLHQIRTGIGFNMKHANSYFGATLCNDEKNKRPCYKQT